MMGWARIYRQLTESDFWQSEQFTKPQAWVDLIVSANHKCGSFWTRGIEIKLSRGQVGWSQLTMATRWKWSRDKVRRFLVWLEKDGKIRQQIIQQTTTIITLLKYEEYQSDKTTSLTTNRQQTDNKQDTNKNDKNENNDNKEILPKKTNPLNLTRGQVMSYLKAYPGLITSELKSQMAECNNYMGMSSNQYTNPGLFFRGWLKKYMADRAKDRQLAEQSKKMDLPEIPEEERKRNLEQLAEIRSRFKGGVRP